MDLSGFCVVMTTTDSEAGAERIAQALLEARLAACVQISSRHEPLHMERRDRAGGGMGSVDQGARGGFRRDRRGDPPASHL